MCGPTSWEPFLIIPGRMDLTVILCWEKWGFPTCLRQRISQRAGRIHGTRSMTGGTARDTREICFQTMPHMGVGYQYHPYTTYGHYWVQLFTGGCTTQSISIVDDQNYIYLLPAGGSIDNLGLIVEARCEHGVLPTFR